MAIRMATQSARLRLPDVGHGILGQLRAVASVRPPDLYHPHLHYPFLTGVETEKDSVVIRAVTWRTVS
jgi:hypothetical protein